MANGKSRRKGRKFELAVKNALNEVLRELGVDGDIEFHTARQEAAVHEVSDIVLMDKRWSHVVPCRWVVECRNRPSRAPTSRMPFVVPTAITKWLLELCVRVDGGRAAILAFKMEGNATPWVAFLTTKPGFKRSSDGDAVRVIVQVDRLRNNAWVVMCPISELANAVRDGVLPFPAVTDKH